MSLRGNEKPGAIFLVLTGLAVLLGLYARFWALGGAPVGIDEYYLSRSIDGILKYGLPAFDCGGFYQRGLLLQYIIAGLRLAGLSAELAPRLIATLGSLAVLPAIYLVGRRFLSANATLAVIGLLAVSLWQVELARFGRFYAPFQGVFAWYLVYYLKVVVDREPKAWMAMWWLTILAAFVWEGAIFITLANFIPLLINVVETKRIERIDLRRAFVNVVLVVGSYALIAAPARFWSPVPAHADGYSPADIVNPKGMLDLLSISPQSILAQPLWLAVFSALLLFTVVALRRLPVWRDRPLALLGLAGACLAALAGKFGIVVSVVVVLTLLKQFSGSGNERPPLRGPAIALGAALVYWVCYVGLGVDWGQLVAESHNSILDALVVAAYQLFAVPDFVGEIIRPFSTMVPRLGLMLALALAVSLLVEVIEQRALRTPRRMLLLVVVLVVLGVSASHPPRHETRYVAFLYPLLLLLWIAAATGAAELLRLGHRRAEFIGLLAALVIFAATEDFAPRHLITVANRDTMFRHHISFAMQGHLGEVRDDFRAVASWLDGNSEQGKDTVITGVHGLDYYYPYSSYLFVERDSSNFRDWACLRGTVDRWTNLPLMSNHEVLRRTVAASRRTYLVTWDFTVADLQSQFADLGAQVVFTEGSTVIIRLEAPRQPARAVPEVGF